MQMGVGDRFSRKKSYEGSMLRGGGGVKFPAKAMLHNTSMAPWANVGVLFGGGGRSKNNLKLSG